ncbi:hypothetical protein LEP3755_09380 [Leptolyngbya sp. NIES-3755]|nr:hypothetical protein LEP3755_09380 [Leptolyngbya sp. NIES-3755]
MLDTLTVHFNTIQQFSQFRAGTHDRAVDRKNLADQIEIIIEDVNQITNLVEQQWDSFSENQKQVLRDYLLSIDRSLELLTGWNKFILWVELFPTSIRKRKSLPDRLVQSLARFEQVISDKIARDNIREGWKDAMTGRTIPISELWDELDDEG